MLVTVEGIPMDVRTLQPAKALFPILVTLGGMINESKYVQSENASSQMISVPSLIIKSSSFPSKSLLNSNNLLPSLLYIVPNSSSMASSISCSAISVSLAISLSAGAGADGVLFSVSLFVAIFVAFYMLVSTKIGK